MFVVENFFYEYRIYILILVFWNGILKNFIKIRLGGFRVRLGSLFERNSKYDYIVIIFSAIVGG